MPQEIKIYLNENLRPISNIVTDIYQYSSVPLYVFIDDSITPAATPTFNWITPGNLQMDERGLTRNATYDETGYCAYTATIYPFMTSGVPSSQDFGKALISIDVDDVMCPIVKIPVDRTILPSQLDLPQSQYEELLDKYNELPMTRSLFTQTTIFSVTNKNTETVINGNGIGSKILPANTLIPGRVIDFTASGYISALNGTTSTLKIFLGGVTLISDTSTFPIALSNVEFELHFQLVCYTDGLDGTVIGQGGTLIYAGQGLTTNYTRSLKMNSVVNVNTHLANEFSASYKWATTSPSNSLVVTNLNIKIIA